MKSQVIKKNPNVTVLFPHGVDEPFTVKIISSGWQGRYHVISEWGDTGETTHKLMKVIELIDFYSLGGNDLPINDVLSITKEEILGNPNDSDLGALVRKKIY